MKAIKLPPLPFILIFNIFHVGNIINAIGLSMYIVDRFGATDFQVGLLGGVQLLSYGCVAWTGGLLADRFPKRALMEIGLFLLTCGFFALPYAPSLLLVLIIAGFCSVVQIIVFPPSFGLLAESVRPGKLSRVLGMNGASLVFGGVIAAFFVGRLLENHGPKTTFHTSAFLSLSIAIYVVFFAPRRESGAPDGEDAKSMAEGSGDHAGNDIGDAQRPGAPLHPQRRVFMIAALVLNFTGFLLAITHQTFLARLATLPEFSLSLSRQSDIQSLRLFAAMLGYGLGSVWSGWHWRFWPFWTLAVWYAIVSIVAVLAPNPIVLAAAIGCGGVGTALGNQMSLYYAIGGGAVGHGKGAGLTETALALGGGLGPLLGGVVALMAATPRAALAVPLLPVLISVVIWGFLFRRNNGATRAAQ